MEMFNTLTQTILLISKQKIYSQLFQFSFSSHWACINPFNCFDSILVWLNIGEFVAGGDYCFRLSFCMHWVYLLMKTRIKNSIFHTFQQGFCCIYVNSIVTSLASRLYWCGILWRTDKQTKTCSLHLNVFCIYCLYLEFKKNFKTKYVFFLQYKYFTYTQKTVNQI